MKTKAMAGKTSKHISQPLDRDFRAHVHIEPKIDRLTENPENPRSPVQTPQKRSRGRPQTHGLTGSPTYQSYKSAKRRCTNPKDSQYADYGGRGIKFRFASVQEMVADIGERPPGLTLDRVNPNGHYEPGNIRWSTPKEQANNRRPQNFYGEKVIRERWYTGKQDRDEKRRSYRRWSLSVKLFDWGLAEWELQELTKLCVGRKAPYATFELEDPRDAFYPDTGFVRLPCLNTPHGHFVLNAGPFGEPISRLSGRGFISGMSKTDLVRNCTLQEIDVVLPVLHGRRCVCYTGSGARFNDIPIEGRLMALAAQIANCRSVWFVPVAQLEADLLADNVEHLVAGCLVIPDLQVSAPGFGLDRGLRSLALQFLQMRLNNGLPTLVYAEDPIQLGRDLALFFETHYTMVQLEDLPARPSPAVSFFEW